MVPEDDVNNAVALNSALMTSSRIIGPALAGLLIAVGSYSWAFGLDGLSYIAVIVGLWMMNPGQIRRSPVAERGKRVGGMPHRVPVRLASHDDGDRRGHDVNCARKTGR